MCPATAVGCVVGMAGASAQGRAPFSPAVLLELPLGVVEGADLAGLQPAGDAVEVEGMVAPGFCHFFVLLNE